MFGFGFLRNDGPASHPALDPKQSVMLGFVFQSKLLTYKRQQIHSNDQYRFSSPATDAASPDTMSRSTGNTFNAMRLGVVSFGAVQYLFCLFDRKRFKKGGTMIL